MAGKEIFVGSAGCGGCHTVEGYTRGAVGPNLDELAPTAAQVKAKVERGFANDPVVAKVVAFIKAGGSRPLMKATKTGSAGEGSPAGAS